MESESQKKKETKRFSYLLKRNVKLLDRVDTNKVILWEENDRRVKAEVKIISK